MNTDEHRRWFFCCVTRAWLRFLRGEAAGAQASLEESWQIAEDGLMRLHLAASRRARRRLLVGCFLASGQCAGRVRFRLMDVFDAVARRLLIHEGRVQATSARFL